MLVRKQPAEMGGSGRGVFLRQQQRKDTLFLISRPVLETTLASLECIWRFCQCLYTSCPRLIFLSPYLLHTFTQHSLWHLKYGYRCSKFLHLFYRHSI